MKILLVDNASSTFSELQETVSAAGHDVTSITHKEIPLYAAEDYDAAVLSGGWWYDDETELLAQYAEELEFIRLCPIPLLGICIGMQLMHVALDRAVPLLDEPQSGMQNITVTETGIRYGLQPKMRVFKNHTRGIIDADPIFEVLATSPGHIEIMRHRERPMLGVQFHPEIGDIDERVRMLGLLLGLIIFETQEQKEGVL